MAATMAVGMANARSWTRKHEPAFAVTETVPAPPAAVGELAVGEIASVQTTAACVTVNDWPPTLIVPVREDVFGFAATL